MLQEFRAFLMRGNVIELAVGLAMGAAFTAIVNSLVNNIIMPIVGILLGGIDFSSLTLTVGDAVVSYGVFIQAVINFLAVGLVLFLLVKLANTMQRRFVAQKPATPPTIPEDVKLLTEIRDLLKQRA